MWNPIRRWLFNRSRYVYQFWNGQRYVKADPLTIWRTLQQHEDYRDEDFKLLKVESLRSELIGKFAGFTRQVFGIKLPDEGGLTELECLDVLRAFISYTGFQKKSGEPTPILLPPTEPEPCIESSEQTNTSEDSEST